MIPLLEQEKLGEGHFGAAVSARPIRRWTTGRRAETYPTQKNYVIFFQDKYFPTFLLQFL